MLASAGRALLADPRRGTSMLPAGWLARCVVAFADKPRRSWHNPALITCRSKREAPSVSTNSSLRLASAEWARCTAPVTLA